MLRFSGNFTRLFPSLPLLLLLLLRLWLELRLGRWRGVVVLPGIVVLPGGAMVLAVSDEVYNDERSAENEDEVFRHVLLKASTTPPVVGMVGAKGTGGYFGGEAGKQEIFIYLVRSTAAPLHCHGVIIGSTSSPAPC